MKTRQQQQAEALEAHRRFAEQQVAQAQLLERLSEQFLTPAMPESLREKVGEYAWTEGHASGEHEVEMIYGEIANLIVEAFEQGRKYEIDRFEERA